MGDELVVQRRGTERLDETVVAYQTVLQGNMRRSAIEPIRSAERWLYDDERLWVVAQAQLRGAYKVPVVLFMTDKRLITVNEQTFDVIDSTPRSELSIAEWRDDFMWGNRMHLRKSHGLLELRQVLPTHQANRILLGLDGTPTPESVQLLSGLCMDPEHPPIACMWELSLYEDRLIDQAGRHLPFTREVQATVDSAGNIAVTRGRNLAAKGLGTLAFGPVGLFFMGNAREHQIDTRELYLLVEGPEWAYTQKFVPEVGAGLRQFAQLINITARRYRQRTDPPPPPPPPPPAAAPDVAGQLRELAELRREGVLTDDEFAQAKAKLLDSN